MVETVSPPRMAYACTHPPPDVVTIYCLRLERGKYYVGLTRKEGFDRLDAHRSGKGAAWTKKYKPIGQVWVEADMKPADEDRLTLEMMAKYGVANVRGGDWCQLRLPEATYRGLVKKTGKMTQGPCGRCGRDTHGRSKCFAKTTIDGVKITTKSWVFRPLKPKDKVEFPRTRRQTIAGGVHRHTIKKPKAKLTKPEKFGLKMGRTMYGSARGKSVKWMKANLPYYELLKDRYKRGF